MKRGLGAPASPGATNPLYGYVHCQFRITNLPSVSEAATAICQVHCQFRITNPLPHPKPPPPSVTS
ncbi:hypothetical protein, partial [Pseudonocardia sp. GCM10023141]|uniref:hypothetical protein n=1 Tax=Pseudonocardia sp. GCM10023141 TaxID=3252653 RepID=UPI00360CCCD6